MTSFKTWKTWQGKDEFKRIKNSQNGEILWDFF